MYRKGGEVTVREFVVKLIPEGDVQEICVYANDKDEAESVVQTLIDEDILQNVSNDCDIANSAYEIGSIEYN